MDGTDDNADWAEVPDHSSSSYPVNHQKIYHSGSLKKHFFQIFLDFTTPPHLTVIIIIIPMLQVLQAMDAMGFDGNEQGEIISAVRLSISHGDDDYEEIL